MEKQLPKNWVETELGNIINLMNGYAFKSNDYSNEGVPVIRMSDIENNEININKAVRVPDKKEYDKFIINLGDILIGMSGSIGKYGIFNLNKKVYLNQRVGNLRLISENHTNKKLIYYFIGQFQKEIVDKAYGGAVPNISGKQIEECIFPFPPLAEQNRIVAKLDVLFTQLETIQSSMAIVPSLLKDFRQQVLTQAFTGKLTEEWRKGNKLKEWTYELAQDCCEKVQSGGTPKGSNFETTGIPFLKVYNIVNNKVDFEYNPQYVSELIQNSQLKKSITYPGDVIMNIVGPPLNKIAIIPNDYEEWNLNQAITLFRTKAYLSNKFLYYFFCEGSSVNKLVNETRGVVGQVNISLSQCRNFEIPIPSPKEQQEIVFRIESLFNKADAIEKQYESLKTKIDVLPQALLHKAFKGELTEQLDSDGDAKDLLEQIQELKKTIKSKKK